MKYISANKAAILSVLEPVTVLGVDFVVLGEALSLRQLVGAVIVMISALLISFKEEAPHAPLPGQS